MSGLAEMVEEANKEAEKYKDVFDLLETLRDLEGQNQYYYAISYTNNESTSKDEIKA